MALHFPKWFWCDSWSLKKSDQQHQASTIWWKTYPARTIYTTGAQLVKPSLKSGPFVSIPSNSKLTSWASIFIGYRHPYESRHLPCLWYGSFYAIPERVLRLSFWVMRLELTPGFDNTTEIGDLDVLSRDLRKKITFDCWLLIVDLIRWFTLYLS